MLNLLYDIREEKSVDLTVITPLISEYATIREALSKADKRKKELANIIKSHMGHCKKGYTLQHQLSLSQFAVNRFDTTKYKQDHPVQFARYCKKYNQSRLNIKENS